MTRYATLFGFGLFDPTNKKYKGYLDRFVLFVKRKKIDEIILCGGHTNVAEPNKSEAGTIADYIRPQIPRSVKIHLEDKSITTEQNLKFAKDFINLDPENEIFVITEGVRFFKVTWILLDKWFGLNREQITEYWQKMFLQVYGNPNQKETTMKLNNLKKFLKYKNVRIIVDNFHKDYKNGFHTIISQTFEIDGLYNQKVYEEFMRMTKKKLKMS